MRDRIKLWRATLRVIAAHPLVGVGLDNLWPALVRYGYRHLPKAPRHVPRRKFLRAHSAPLHVLATTGLLGGAVGLATLATMLEVASRGGGFGDSSLRAALAGYLVALLAGFHSPATAALAAVLAGALVGLGG